MIMDKAEIEIDHLRQVVFSLQRDIKNLKEEIDLIHGNRFSDGIMASITLMHSFDTHTMAVELARASLGKDYLQQLHECAFRSGSKCDRDSVKWLAAKEDSNKVQK